MIYNENSEIISTKDPECIINCVLESIILMNQRINQYEKDIANNKILFAHRRGQIKEYDDKETEEITIGFYKIYKSFIDEYIKNYTEFMQSLKGLFDDNNFIMKINKIGMNNCIAVDAIKSKGIVIPYIDHIKIHKYILSEKLEEIKMINDMKSDKLNLDDFITRLMKVVQPTTTNCDYITYVKNMSIMAEGSHGYISVSYQYIIDTVQFLKDIYAETLNFEPCQIDIDILKKFDYNDVAKYLSVISIFKYFIMKIIMKYVYSWINIINTILGDE